MMEEKREKNIITITEALRKIMDEKEAERKLKTALQHKGVRV